MAKVANNWNDLVKGSLTRQKLQNSKYAKSPEFSPALGLIIFRKKSAPTNLRYIRSLKSVRLHFAYGRIALTLELLGRFGRFLDEDDRCNPPILLIPFSRLLGL